ncbi:MAG: hypothetical protein LBS96_01130 [Oscillospiraceae bacterium]|nr:hypothetical protein [Oscillospiraceae bacterium]
MKHSQTKRILSFLLAALMLVTMSSIMASARWDYAQPYDIQKGKAVMNTGQCATMICDFLDETLNDSIGVILARTVLGVEGFGGTVLWIDLSSIDMMAISLNHTFGSYAKTLLNDLVGLGDLNAINTSGLATIEAQFLRSNSSDNPGLANAKSRFTYPNTAGSTSEREGKRDIYVLQSLFKFLADNAGMIGKLVGSNNKGTSYNGQFSFGGLIDVLSGKGLIGGIVALATDIEPLKVIAGYMTEMSNDFGGWLKGLLLPMLAPEADPSAPLDLVIEEMLNGLLGPLLGDLLPGVELTLDIYQNPGDPPVDSAYDMLRNTINGVLVGAFPMLLGLIAPLMNVAVDEEHPGGYYDASLGDGLIGGILWGPLVVGGEGLDGLLSETPIPHSEDPGASPAESAHPYKMLQETFEWLLLRGTDGTSFLDRFLLRNYPTIVSASGETVNNPAYDSTKPKGLIIKDAPTDSRYKDALADFLGTLIDDKLAGVLGMIDLGIDLDTDAIQGLALPEKFGFVIKALLPMIVNYIYVPNEAESLREVATYILVDLLADTIPEKRYDLISRNAKAVENAGKNIDPNQLSTGKQLNPSTDGVYVVLGDLLRYYLNPSVAGLNLPENKTFDGLLSALSAWLLGAYGGVLRTPLTTDDDGWSRLSYLLFGSSSTAGGTSHVDDGVLRKDWFTEGIVNSGGEAVLKEVLINRLLGAVLDLDFKSLFTIFQGNSNGELNLPPVQLVLHVVARLLNSVFKMESGQTLIPWNLTTLDSLLGGKVLGALVQALLTQFGKPEVTSALLGPVLPLLAGMIGLWSADDYLPHLVTEEEVNGIRNPDDNSKWSVKPKAFLAPSDAMIYPSVNDFKTLLNLVQPLEQSVEWYVLPNLSNLSAPYYHHYGPENFIMEDQYRYNFYADARSTALSVLARMEVGATVVQAELDDVEEGEEPDVLTQYEISNAYAVLAFYTNNSWNSGKYDAQPLLSSLRSDEQISNGGLEFQHLRLSFERLAKKGYVEEHYTKGSWAVYEHAYNFAYELLERYYDMTLKGITQAAITRARHELLIAERQLTKFSKLASFIQFDIYMQTEMEIAERDAVFYTSGDPETIGTIDYLLAVLEEARVMSANRSTYDVTEQEKSVDPMAARMHEAFLALTKKNLIYADSGARIYYGIENPVERDPEIHKIVYGLPYGLTYTLGTKNLATYVRPFTSGIVLTWPEDAATKATYALKYLGTGLTFKIRSGKGASLKTDDAVVLLIFGDIAGNIATGTGTPLATANTQTDMGESLVNGIDVQVLDQYLAGKRQLTDLQLLAADVNHSGGVDWDDRELLYQATLGQYTIEQTNFNW